MDTFTLADIDIKKVTIDRDFVNSSTSEDHFMTLSVELLKEVAAYTSVVAGILKNNPDGSPRKLHLQEAVFSGMFTRIVKLQSAFLLLTCELRDRETGEIILRCIADTIINLHYLLKNSSMNVVKGYIAYSLKKEKRFLELIDKSILQRGTTLPIEERMKKSINHSFETSGLKPEDITDELLENWESNVFERAKNVGMEDYYSALISLPSHAVHGNWQDLLTYHLEHDGEYFMPSFERNIPRPQPILAIALLSTVTNNLYISNKLPNSEDKTDLLSNLDDLQKRIKLLDQLHEEFLQK